MASAMIPYMVGRTVPSTVQNDRPCKPSSIDELRLKCWECINPTTNPNNMTRQECLREYNENYRGFEDYNYTRPLAQSPVNVWQFDDAIAEYLGEKAREKLKKEEIDKMSRAKRAQYYEDQKNY